MVYLKVRAMKFIALLDLPKYTGLNFHLSSPLLSFHPRYEIHQSQIPYAHYQLSLKLHTKSYRHMRRHIQQDIVSIDLIYSE